MPDTKNIYDIIVAVAGREVSAEEPLSDIGVDSLSLVELAVRLEDATGVRSDTVDFSRLSTVGDLVSYIVPSQPAD
ncbi:acyl carrier protein [Corynebacterium glucuronolyticum]|uniref:acyl carrier protein n=1 Tax=Corynebacterium glucuronolyticum TaxID=39791 RepID=UPI00019C1A2D|nr:acyl carrier protein [Corynebacterium glucuronolyticum]EEI26956.1 phosphopantetheine attachment domain protein [Corynebacterium glucuronolyticum ATCC 51867]QRO82841.1 acyl carrier protein [Corynebacterium glucuronolyticum]